jgi:hypothetical protein
MYDLVAGSIKFHEVEILQVFPTVCITCVLLRFNDLKFV